MNKIDNLFEGVSNASFGEIVQGMSTDHDDFLITIPIDLQTKATFVLNEGSDKIEVLPSYKTKVRKFLEILKEDFNLSFGGTVTIDSMIPEGKGLSSSTADMVAAFRAVNAYLKKDFDLESIGQILRRIEPSDGVLYQGSVVYKHKKCSLVKKLGYFPETYVIAIDEGGVLDTISYNKVQKNYSEEERYIYSLLIKDIDYAFSINDYKRIGMAATQSALMNQKYNNKKNLLHAIDLLDDVNGLGIITTHSGTCIGIIIDPKIKDVEPIVAKLSNVFPNDDIVVYKTLGAN